MSPGEQIARILATLPPLLWVGLACYAVWLMRDAVVGVIGRTTSVEAFSVKLAMSSTRAMTAAIEMARKNSRWTTEVASASATAALARASRERENLEGAEILWVDDRPSNNRNETRMLAAFGAAVTFATTTDEAIEAQQMAATQAQPFHLVLSDISREIPGQEPTAGLAMLSRLRKEGFTQPVIFYIGSCLPEMGTPAGAFGITDRPDELLNLIMDALGRVRGR